MEFINKIYFSIFVFSLIVFVDLMVKFKRPIILKIYLSILTLGVGLNALIYTLQVPSNYFVISITLLKGLISFSIINVFTILYIPKFQKWVNVLGIIFLIYEIILCNLIVSNTILFQVPDQKVFLFRMRSEFPFPLYLNIYRILMHFAFIAAMIYTTFWLVFKQNHQNIYYEKIKLWSKLLIFFILLIFLAFVPLSFFSISESLAILFSILIFLILLFFVFYRPVFLNRSALKITLGINFNRNTEYAISELEFINEFYTNLYFLKNDASLENLATVLNISSNDLYKFIYYKYSMTFNDLVNKNRVDYFIDIIHNPKYLNFTIDALAKEAGFTSRQHLYKPFKKFHGGNPSDIIDALAV